jgi:type II secretory pathway pseudopilin PulG
MTDEIANGEDGSLLIEALVAFVILATVVVMAFQIFGDGLRRMNTVEPKLLAMAVARKQLALMESQTTAFPTRLEGTDETGLRWQMALDPVIASKVDWTLLRPFRVRMWIGTAARDFSGEPLVETVMLAPVPKQ